MLSGECEIFQMHTGEHALRTAQAKVDELLGPLKSKNNEREALKHEIETVSIKVRRRLKAFPVV